jgi:hypothetical protein
MNTYDTKLYFGFRDRDDDDATPPPPRARAPPRGGSRILKYIHIINRSVSPP